MRPSAPVIGAAVIALAAVVAIAHIVSTRAKRDPQQAPPAVAPKTTEGSIEAVIDPQDEPLSEVARTETAVEDQELQVRFPDGTLVSVRMREVHPDPPPVDVSESLTSNYAKLRSLAESGNAAAARTLSRELQRCRRAYSDEASLNAAINRLRATRVVIYPNGSRPSVELRPGDDVATFVERELESPYEHCEGITNEQKAEAAQWARVAADGGDYLGFQDWATELGWTQAGFDAWENVWERGYKAALTPLAMMYRKGIPTSAGGQPDYVRAYAYSFVGFKLREAAYAGSASQAHRGRLVAMEDSLRHWSSYLTPQQTDEAVSLAKQILTENHNCCAGSW